MAIKAEQSTALRVFMFISKCVIVQSEFKSHLNVKETSLRWMLENQFNAA